MNESAAVPRFRVYSPLLSTLKKKLGKFFGLFLLVLVPLLFFRTCALKYVPPNEIGVRQISVGPSKGIVHELVSPGYRREIFSYEKIRTLPRNVQVIEFTDNPTEASSRHRTLNAINVPTVDGYPVNVDITVLYRIADPFKVVTKFGFGRQYEDNVVIRFTDPFVKQNLGELRAEEFYRDARLAKVRNMKSALAQKFAENGLQLVDILVRQYDYPDTFQSLTEQKKIQDQSVLTNRALAKQAEVQTRLNQVIAEGTNQVNIQTAEFQAQITDVNAQKDLYQRSKQAEADLLVKSAEADGTELINRAMEGAGSDKLLRLRKGLAVLNSIKGPIYVSEDPTDLSTLIGGKH